MVQGCRVKSWRGAVVVGWRGSALLEVQGCNLGWGPLTAVLSLVRAASSISERSSLASRFSCRLRP